MSKPTLDFRGLLAGANTKVQLHDTVKVEVANQILSAITSQYETAAIEVAEIYQLLSTPPKPDLGDLCFPCFILSKSLKQNPAAIATSLASTLSKQFDEWQTHATGPYINFHIPHTRLHKEVLQAIGSGAFFQRSLLEHAEKTMIEYSQPNTHKELHVGHMRNICFGQTLINCLRHLNIPVVTSTFPGDVGTHVAKCLWYYKNHNTENAPTENRGAWLGALYAKSVKKFDSEIDSPQGIINQEQVSNILREVENKTGEYYQLWQETREWSIEQLQTVYAWAGVAFDTWYWESEVDSDSVALVKKLFAEGKVVESQGALGVDLEEQGLGFCLLLKADGNGLYATKDVLLAQRKIADFQVEKNIVIVDLRQSHHFKQVFAVLEHIDFPQAKNCFHLPYNFVELPDGAMSSRKGNIVPIQTLIERMESTVIEQYLQQFESDWGKEEVTATARLIAQGAIKFGMNSMDPATKIIFDLESWLRLDGQSGPYIQYTCARIRSLFRKAEITEDYNCDPTLLNGEQERQLLLQLSDFNSIIINVAETLKTNLLCSYLIDVCRAYNRFYAERQVLNSDEVEVTKARLALCQATLVVLKKGLNLLGIEAPERM